MTEPILFTAPALDRRSLLKVLALGAAATGGFGNRAPAQETPAAAPSGEFPPPGMDPAAPAARLTEADPSLVQPVRSPWPLVLTAPELETATALADVILPADEKSPSASAAGVPAFLNEWVSAPYPVQKKDLATVRGGLSWLNTESFTRFGTDFARLSGEQKTAICDDICYLPETKPEHLAGARFFAAFRDLSASGYYTTAAGFEDLGYTGNRPSPAYDGASKEVLARLGL
ncbi:MAG: gluconate 2-dehydrogenase subunit 3 family protein [Verrucomicrobiota bacterium]